MEVTRILVQIQVEEHLKRRSPHGELGLPRESFEELKARKIH